MMMNCPRCGFSQPADRFCAQCGLDVQNFQPRKTPIWKKIAQNSTVHLFILFASIVLAIGYILVSQSELLGKEMGAFLGDNPILSRDARVGGEEPPEEKPYQAVTPVQAQPPVEKAVEPASTEVSAASTEGEGAAPTPPPATAPELELTFWEVPREILMPLLSSADKTNDGGEGKILVWGKAENVLKVLEALESTGQKLEGGRTFSLNNSPVTVEDGTDGAPLQFGLKIDVTKSPAGEFNLKFALDWHMPAAGTAEVSRTVQSSIDGLATIPFKGLVMIIMDPADRTIVKPDLAKTVNGPMTIFSSEEFRGGATDWVMVVH